MEQVPGNLVEKSSPLLKQLPSALNLSLLVCEMGFQEREGREAKLGWVGVIASNEIKQCFAFMGCPLHTGKTQSILWKFSELFLTAHHEMGTSLVHTEAPLEMPPALGHPAAFKMSACCPPPGLPATQPRSLFPIFAWV